MAFAYVSIDDLGTGVFRKVRQALGVTAFGVNAMVLPAQTGWFEHFHDEQDELYFVHRGLAGFEVDGERFELAPGGAVHVESASPRRVWNAGDETLVLLVVGGKGGYIGRDAHMVDPEDEEKRRAFSAGEEAVIRRLPE
jgi:uncharacterized cupin superfamily protein